MDDRYRSSQSPLSPNSSTESLQSDGPLYTTCYKPLRAWTSEDDEIDVDNADDVNDADGEYDQYSNPSTSSSSPSMSDVFLNANYNASIEKPGLNTSNTKAALSSNIKGKGKRLSNVTSIAESAVDDILDEDNDEDGWEYSVTDTDADSGV